MKETENFKYSTPRHPENQEKAGQLPRSRKKKSLRVGKRSIIYSLSKMY